MVVSPQSCLATQTGFDSISETSHLVYPASVMEHMNKASDLCTKHKYLARNRPLINTCEQRMKSAFHRVLEGSDGVQGGGKGCGPPSGSQKASSLISHDGQRVRPKGPLHPQSPDPTLSTPASKREGREPKEWGVPKESIAPELTGGAGRCPRAQSLQQRVWHQGGAFRSEGPALNSWQASFSSESLLFIFSWKKVGR